MWEWEGEYSVKLPSSTSCHISVISCIWIRKLLEAPWRASFHPEYPVLRHLAFILWNLQEDVPNIPTRLYYNSNLLRSTRRKLDCPYFITSHCYYIIFMFHTLYRFILAHLFRNMHVVFEFASCTMSDKSWNELRHAVFFGMKGSLLLIQWKMIFEIYSTGGYIIFGRGHIYFYTF